VPKPNPGRSGDDKNKHEKNERNSPYQQQFQHAIHAYVHVPLIIGPEINYHFDFIRRTIFCQDFICWNPVLY
jgi:hypothetical protein